MTAPATTALDVLGRHLDDVAAAIQNAVDAHARISAAANDPNVEPARSGYLLAYADMAMSCWTKAIGARAALEAAYQELSGGEPSPGHARDTAILAEMGLSPNPVGLQPVPGVPA